MVEKTMPATLREAISLVRDDLELFEKISVLPVAGIAPPAQSAAKLKFVLEGALLHVTFAAFVLAVPKSPAVAKSAKIALARVGRVVFMGGVWLGGVVGKVGVWVGGSRKGVGGEFF